MEITYVFFNTDDKIYSKYADLLKRSLEHHNLNFHQKIISKNDWLSVVNYKPEFLRECREQLEGVLCYVDADAYIHQKPNILFSDFDIAAVRFRDYYTGKEENLTSTILINDTTEARKFLENWVDVTRSDTEQRWDQSTFSEVLDNMSDVMRYKRLDYGYAYIFDNKNFLRSGCEPIIEQLQASRLFAKRPWLKKIIGANYSKKAKASLKRYDELLDRLVSES